MCVPERHAESDAVFGQATHLGILFMHGVLIDEKQVTIVESNDGHRLKSGGTSGCCARQVECSLGNCLRSPHICVGVRADTGAGIEGRTVKHV